MFLMCDDRAPASRSGRELLRAAKEFAVESPIRSWWCVVSTLVCTGAVLAFAAVSRWWPGRLAASLLGGLLLVRTFVLFHDFMHGAILRKSVLGRVVFHLVGLLMLCPPRSWRHSHNVHHANVGKPVRAGDGRGVLFISDAGAYPLMTIDMWRRASFGQRLYYRFARHPLTMVFAYLTVFLGGVCLWPLITNPRKYWDSAVSLVLHAAVLSLVWLYSGLWGVLFTAVLPFTIASAVGAYLFFAQHNFPGVYFAPRERWSLDVAALRSSSCMNLGPVLNWLTANIGFHHVHHLNSRIPFYRLPEAMAAILEARQPMVTSLRLRDVLACLRLNLWDPQRECLVPYGEAAAPCAGETE